VLESSCHSQRKMLFALTLVGFVDFAGSEHSGS
jgi:hypothetical protein